jgi:hypothetical protein
MPTNVSPRERHALALVDTHAKGGGAAVGREANAGEAGTLQEGGVEEAEAGAHTLPVTARAWRGLVFAFKVTAPRRHLGG